MNTLFTPIVYPTAVFAETVNGAALPVPPSSISSALTGASTNNTIVAGVAGKVIIVRWVVVWSQGAVSTVALHDSTAGPIVRLDLYVPANTVASPNVILPDQLTGWATMGVGLPLQADVGAVAVLLTVGYVVASLPT